MSKAKQLNEFQHTAARRRLQSVLKGVDVPGRVSTHSRAEAAADPLWSEYTTFARVSTHRRAEAAAAGRHGLILVR